MLKLFSALDGGRYATGDSGIFLNRTDLVAGGSAFKSVFGKPVRRQS